LYFSAGAPGVTKCQGKSHLLNSLLYPPKLFLTLKHLYYGLSKSNTTNLEKERKCESPLFLRVIKNCKATFISIGLYIQEVDWDEVGCKVKKSHRNSGRLNAFIGQKVAEAEAIMVDEQAKVKTVSARKLKDKIVGIEPVDFFEYSKRYIESLLNGNQISTYKRANAVVQKLKDYNDNKPLYLGEITHTYLEGFEKYCKAELENRQNTLHVNLRIIRKVVVKPHFREDFFHCVGKYTCRRLLSL